MVEIDQDLSFTNSETVAKNFGVAHNEILKKIRDINEKELTFSRSMTRTIRGRDFEKYDLTEVEALKLIMSINGERSGVFKNAFVSFVCCGFDSTTAYQKAMLETLEFNKEDKSVVTYIAENLINGMFKIGRTTQTPSARLRAIQCSTGDALELVAFISKDVEQELHKTYKNNKKSSEWFEITYPDVHEICSRYRANFLYVDTFMSQMFDLWHSSEDGTPEPTMDDFFPNGVTAKLLNLAKQSIKKHMEEGEHYKVVFELVKQDLINFADGLFLTNTTGK